MVKVNVIKIRSLYYNYVLSGFVGSIVDVFSLFDMFERILESKKGDLFKSVVDFSKEWRKDKYLC